MGPKKKKGGKKKVGGGSNETGEKWVYKTPIILPPVTDQKSQAVSFAVSTSDVRSMVRLVAHYNYGTHLAATDVNGSTPLHMAAKKGDVPMLKLLISYRKIDPDLKELKVVGGYAAIHHACLEGHAECVKVLAENGADVDIKADSPNGESPLHICCKLNMKECARVLIQSGANVDNRDSYGNNASFWASSKQHFDIIRDLNLPPSKSANAQEFLKLQMSKIKGFVLPPVGGGKKGKGGGKGKGKGGKKGKKK